MAILSNNALLSGLSGKLGGLVFKRYKDKVVVSIKPDKRKSKGSLLQEKRRERFAAAVKCQGCFK